MTCKLDVDFWGLSIPSISIKELGRGSRGGAWVVSSRSRDRQLGWRGCMARQQLEDRAVPHLCVDKLGGTTGE